MDQSLTVIGINCNGLSGKRNSLTANVEILKPTAFFVQETKFMKRGLFKLNDFEIFESIRPTGGGSILTGIHCSHNPVLISDGATENIEILVVEGEMNKKKCRFINGYGPQESADVDSRINFFARLEEEIIKAKLNGSMICIELDANAKLGGDIIKDDPHKRSANGELLLGILVRNNLIVCNGTAQCSGLITRERQTVNGSERSIIDFLIVCEELFYHMKEMKIDEEKKYAITSYNNGKVMKVTRTDHNMLIGKFDLKVLENVPQHRTEIFKYNDVEGQKKFKELTSKKILSRCFEEQDILKASARWLKELQNILHRCFKKVRVGRKKNTTNVIVENIKLKHELTNQFDTLVSDLKNGSIKSSSAVIKKKHDLEDKLEEVEIVIAESSAKQNAKIIEEHFEELTSDGGEFSVNKMWNLKKKLSLRDTEVPTAMQDQAGNLICGKGGLRNLYQTTYTERLSHKPIKSGWEKVQSLKESLFEERIKLCSARKTEGWDLDKIKKICKKLKTGKARDRDDLTYELFKPNMAGDDMMLSLQMMFNGIKQSISIPNFLEKMFITSLYKNKGCKSSFQNQRGVFNVSKVRSILDKVLYDDVYDLIDDELSYSNIGGRKGRNIRDHLFIVYGVINDVMNGSSPPVDIQSIDIHKCFDEMWYQETHNDMFDVKVNDDRFALIAKMDETANVIVKTPCGPTDEFSLDRLIMQGSVFGPIKATIQIDTLGRDCENYNQGMFLYKNVLSLTPLALIDDCLGFSRCGADAVELNAIINTKIHSKKLRLSETKCHHLHVDKSSTLCYTDLKADESTMKKSTECSYLGDILSTSGSMNATIESRRQKGVGICSQITGMVNGLSLGHYYFKISFLFRETMLVNGILTNAEVWYPVSDAQLEVLENIDLMLIRKIVKGHSKTAKEALFLETGLMPLKFICMKRRLMYLHTIVSRESIELTRRFYEVQKSIYTKNDWFQLVQQNKVELMINYTDEEISKMSKDKFRIIVNRSVENFALAHLNTVASGHSKSLNLIKHRLVKESYFEDHRFSKSDSELLLALRTRMVKDIKRNFSTQYNNNNIACDLCHVQVDCQEHLLSCDELRKHVTVPKDVQYKDIYGNTDKQLKIVKVMKQLLRKRELLRST